MCAHSAAQIAPGVKVNECCLDKQSPGGVHGRTTLGEGDLRFKNFLLVDALVPGKTSIGYLIFRFQMLLNLLSHSSTVTSYL